MAYVLKIKDENGNVIDVPAIVGPKGPAGADGAPGEDGVGIRSVVQTTTSTADGGTNIITVTKTDGSTSTFSVKNGSKGSGGADGADGKDATINGVNALTIETDEYLSATMNGSKLKLGLQSAPNTSQATVVTLAAAGWSEQSNGRYTQSAAVDFMTADAPVVMMDVYMTGADPDADDAMEAEFLGNVYRMTQADGSVTFWARAVPEVSLQLVVGVS